MSNYSEQFLRQNPLAVLGVLRDLKSQQVPLRISRSDGQFVNRALIVSPDELVMDFGSQECGNRTVQWASQISIIAETQRAKIGFTLPQLRKDEYQQLPVFISSLPSSLWFVQHREYFHVDAPLHPPYRCTARMSGNSTLCFRLFDSSLGDMGGLLETAKPEGLIEGVCFVQVELDMEQWGVYHVDAQLISVSERKAIGNKNEIITTSRLSFCFLNVSPVVERNLQRITFSLEREARERSNRVRG